MAKGDTVPAEGGLDVSPQGSVRLSKPLSSVPLAERLARLREARLRSEALQARLPIDASSSTEDVHSPPTPSQHLELEALAPLDAKETMLQLEAIQG